MIWKKDTVKKGKHLYEINEFEYFFIDRCWSDNFRFAIIDDS